MKTNEELNALKDEVETLNAKLAELTGEELGQVCGGGIVAPEIEDLCLGKIIDDDVSQSDILQ